MIDPGVAVCSGRGMFIKSPENGLTVRQGFPDLRVRMKAPQLAPCPSIERWSRSVFHSGESRARESHCSLRIELKAQNNPRGFHFWGRGSY